MASGLLAELVVKGRQVVYRIVTMADKPAVMEMSSEDIYGGHDYLPCIFDMWVVQPESERFCFGALVDGNLAGFWSVWRPGGGVAVTQAARVHTSYRGLGLSSRAMRERGAWILARWPEITTMRETTFSKAVVVLHQWASLGGTPIDLQLIAGWPQQALPVVTTAFDSDHPPAEKVNATEASRVLLENVATLVPSGIGCFDWHPLPLTTETFTHELAGCAFAVTAGADVGVSMGDLSSRVAGLEYYCTVYATTWPAVRRHVAFHARRAAALPIARGGFVACVPPTFQKEFDALREQLPDSGEWFKDGCIVCVDLPIQVAPEGEAAD